MDNLLSGNDYFFLTKDDQELDDIKRIESKYVNFISQREYYTSNAQEYFAESFSYYITNSERLYKAKLTKNKIVDYIGKLK